jgi:superfamily II DNA/RNA helicase
LLYIIIPTNIQEFKLTSNSDLLRDLHHLLTQHKGKKIIVFFQTVRIAELFSLVVTHAGWSVRMLHGRMDQNERSTIFDDFMQSKFDVLFSTNVAARGLGIHMAKI